MGAAGVAADDYLAQFVNVRPVDDPFFHGGHEVAGFQAGPVLAVHDQDLGAADGFDIDLGLGQEVRADDVHVRPLGDPGAVQHGLAAAGRRDDDVHFVGGQLGASHGNDVAAADLAHLPGEPLAALFVGAED